MIFLLSAVLIIAMTGVGAASMAAARAIRTEAGSKATMRDHATAFAVAAAGVTMLNIGAAVSIGTPALLLPALVCCAVGLLAGSGLFLKFRPLAV